MLHMGDREKIEQMGVAKDAVPLLVHVHVIGGNADPQITDRPHIGGSDHVVVLEHEHEVDAVARRERADLAHESIHQPRADRRPSRAAPVTHPVPERARVDARAEPAQRRDEILEHPVAHHRRDEDPRPGEAMVGVGAGRGR